METYLKPLISAMHKASNAEKGTGAKHYLKDQFEFLGVDTKSRREIMRVFFKENGMPPSEKLEELSFSLWNRPEREFQHVVIDLLHKMVNSLKEKDIIWIEKLIRTKSWWDTVDGMAAWICGGYFLDYKHQVIPVTRKWMDSGNIWLQRTSLLFQLKYKEETNLDLLAEYIDELSNTREFFIRKAIGWVLRELSKSNKAWVQNFVETHDLLPLSYREATRYL